jgi:hypothetical protein
MNFVQTSPVHMGYHIFHFFVVSVVFDAMALALLNCPILTCDGSFVLSTVTLDEALRVVHAAGTGAVTSYIGHASTAAVLATLLSVDVPVSRAEFKQAVGTRALVFALNARQAEGVILSKDDIERIGYTLKLLERTA